MKETCVFCGRDIPGKRSANGDRIRNMSDEELAAWPIKLSDAGAEEIKFCQNRQECEDDLSAGRELPESRCIECMVGWLQRADDAI